MNGFGGREMPPAARSLGFEMTGIDEDGVGCAFVARAEFVNLLGNVQGGYLAAMLDSALGAALLTQLPDGEVAPTLELKVNYLRPAPVGAITGRGRVVHRGGTIAFLAGELRDPDGAVLATATATAKIVRPR